MPGVSFLKRRSQKVLVGYFEIIFCPRCNPEFDQVASFVNRIAVFICFRIIQRHSLTANRADRSLREKQLVAVHLGPSGTAQTFDLSNYLMRAICLSVRYRTNTRFFSTQGWAAVGTGWICRLWG